jgi:hypothetical protein
MSTRHVHASELPPQVHDTVRAHGDEGNDRDQEELGPGEAEHRSSVARENQSSRIPETPPARAAASRGARRTGGLLDAGAQPG